MAWSVVQSASGSHGSGVSATLAVTYGSNVSSGNKLIAALAWGASTVVTVTSVQDGSGNSMTALATVAGTVGGNDTLVALYAMDVPAGDAGTKPTITLTMSTNAPSPSMLIQEVSGLLAGNTTAMMDGTPGTVQDSVTPTTNPSYSSTAANEYLVCVYGDQGATVTYTDPGGYTGDANGVNASGDADIEIARKNSTNGTETGQYSLSGAVGYGVILGAFKLAAAAGVSYVPQRYGQAAPVSPAPWQQRPRQGLPPSPFLLENELLGGAQTPRTYATPATHYARWWMPEQRAYISDPLLLTTALLENELLGGADTSRHYAVAATHVPRWWMPQQRPYISVPGQLLTAELENELLGGADTARHQHAAAYYDRREVPQQRAYISDPSFYPTVAPTDPLTVAWGAGGPYWHLYNRAGDITDRREYFTQRLYQSDPLLLLTALLENELLGGAQTGAYYRVPATHAPRWWMPQQPPRNADPLLIQTAELENELLGGGDVMRHYLAAAYQDRREVPQQRPYISDPSFYPSAAVTDPLTLAWGAGGNYWHLYNRAADATDRREVPQQRNYVSDPLLLTTALLENELLGGAETGKYYRAPATHVPRWWMPEQRPYVSDPLLLLPPVPLDPTTAAWAALWLAYNLAATHYDRRLYPQQRLYFPVPLPPPPFTIGALTAADKATTALTASSALLAALTATDKRAGGLS